MKKLLKHGKNILTVEVTNISMHGIWLLVREKEYFLPFEHFPWFKDQPVSAIFNVVEQSPGHFYWPDLDVDLTEKIIDHPEQFPLLYDQTKNPNNKKKIIKSTSV